MDNPSDFTQQTGIPLDKDVVEQVPVTKYVSEVDEAGQIKTSVKSVMEQRTVRYTHVPKERVRCNTGDHVFRILDNRKYLFACTKCPFVRKVYPTTYTFDATSGKITHRITGQSI